MIPGVEKIKVGHSLIARANPKKASKTAVDALIRNAEIEAEKAVLERDQWIKDEVFRLGQISNRLLHGIIDSELVENLYHVAHEFRGCADYLGISQLARVSEILCAFLDEVEDKVSVPIPILRALVDAALFILHRAPKPIDDQAFQDLCAALDHVTKTMQMPAKETASVIT